MRGEGAIVCVITLLLAGVGAPGQEEFPAERIKAGAGIFAQNCAPCHGPRMADPQGAFDLHNFPPDQKERFVRSVTRGKNNMPPWGDVLSATEIDALWAYVIAGEK
jgi:mono/diheme cytochrome c family protein